MKRVLMAAATVVVIGSAAAANVRADAAPSRAKLRNFVCQRALDPAARAVSVKAQMRPLQGTRKMQLRFQLLSSTRSRRATLVAGGDLGKWITPSNPTLGQRPADQWIVNKQVVNLSAPATYRFKVSFRWLGAHGRVLGSVVRQSAKCFQPELRPDLSVQAITVETIAGRPRLNRYVATIRNGGATAAGPFEILFTSGSSAVQTKNVAGLAAHSKIQRSFVGPACSSASPTTVTVDPNDQVDDFNRANNSLPAVC
jgi:CARDB